MRRLVPVVVPLLALALSACGSNADSQHNTGPASSTGSSGTATVVPAPPTTVTSTATVTVPATTGSAATTVSTATITRPDSGGQGLTSPTAASVPCTAADLTAAAIPPNGAAGTIVLGFTLTNHAAAACRTGGWPGIAFLDGSGHVADDHTTRTTQDALGSTPPRSFSIAAGQQASFRVVVHDVSGSGGSNGCASYPAVQIIAPNDTASISVPLTEGAVTVCGNAGVSPLEPGSSATGQ